MSLKTNATGIGNTAVGTGALVYATGRFNTALGHFAGTSSQTGSYNIVIGAITSSAKPTDATYTANSGLALSSSAASYEMNIGNTILGVNVDSIIGVGKIGINTALDFTMH